MKHSSSNWHALLERAISGLEALSDAGGPIPDWRLGGGTAIMLWLDHRASKDIDIFIDDPQYLPHLSPRTGGEAVWDCEAYHEAANYLKLIYPEGEIDFIVGRSITSMPLASRLIQAAPEKGIRAHRIDVEHPIEIIVKKLFYRGAELKVRDIFDLIVVDRAYPADLRSSLHHVSHKRSVILERLDRINPQFLDVAIDELEIAPEWRRTAESALRSARELAEAIPEPPEGAGQDGS